TPLFVGRVDDPSAGESSPRGSSPIGLPHLVESDRWCPADISVHPGTTCPPARAGRPRCCPTPTPTTTSARCTTPRRPTQNAPRESHSGMRVRGQVSQSLRLLAP